MHEGFEGYYFYCQDDQNVFYRIKGKISNNDYIMSDKAKYDIE